MYGLMERLGNAQNALPIIHIAGTNGKGSVGCYLASLFREAGYSVGRFVSPAVFHPLEEFTFNGEMISECEYEALMDEIRMACADFQEEKLPTFFEAETALAFLWFSRKKPDIVLIECGMGGETDATNVFEKPVASVITSISLEHTKFLGGTLEEIASVKAGIIKKECPVFSAFQEEAVQKTLSEAAERVGASIKFVDEKNLSLKEAKPGRMIFHYHYDNLQLGLETSMAGHYQMMNAALAIECFLGVCKGIKEPYLIVQEGIAKAKWPGRFEVVSNEPLILLDGAHNEGAAIQLEESLSQCFGNERVTMIMGVLFDKNHRSMLEKLLPHVDYLITITPKDNPRALDGRVLLDEAKAIAPSILMEYIENYEEALQKAVIHGKPILACGSLSYLGELRKEIEHGIKSWNEK